MIGQVVKHGRTKRDAKNLHAHLMKDHACKVEILNSVAPDLSEIMSDMAMARDGSRSETAFLHISLSPSRDLSDDEMRKVAGIVMQHFDAEDHQAALVIHEKDRANNEGNRHAHLVLGRVSPDGKVLPSGFDKIKLETAVRIAEFEIGEPCVLGRHHKSSVKWLRENGRDDVADYMIAAHSENPTKPTSPMSPASRQKIERTTGKDLASISNVVKTAWEKSDNGQAFASALREQNYTIQEGKKPGVFVVLHDGKEVGALDRLLKEKRNIVKSKMGDYQYDSTTKNEFERSNTGGTPEAIVRENVRNSRANRAVESVAGVNGKRTDRTDSRSLKCDLVESTTLDDSSRRYRKKRRILDEKNTLIKLDKVRLSATSAIAMQEFGTLNLGKSVSRFDINSAIKKIENYKRGWHWIQEYKDDLMQKIRDFQNRLTAKNPVPKPVSKPNNVTLVHKQEVDFEPEYTGARFG